jgi:hypothetical protein
VKASTVPPPPPPSPLPLTTATATISRTKPNTDFRWNTANRVLQHVHTAQDSRRIQENATRIQENATITAAIHQNQMIKRKEVASQKLQKRLAKKKGIKFVPSMAGSQPQYVPIPKYKETATSKNTFSSSLLLRRAREYNAEDEVQKILLQRTSSRQISMEATKVKKKRADVNLQKRLTLRQSAQQAK